jgi:hypothetical protein
MYILFVADKLDLVVKENDLYDSEKISSKCFECMFDVVIIVILSCWLIVIWSTMVFRSSVWSFRFDFECMRAIEIMTIS